MNDKWPAQKRLETMQIAHMYSEEILSENVIFIPKGTLLTHTLEIDGHYEDDYSKFPSKWFCYYASDTKPEHLHGFFNGTLESARKDLNIVFYLYEVQEDIPIVLCTEVETSPVGRQSGWGFNDFFVMSIVNTCLQHPDINEHPYFKEVCQKMVKNTNEYDEYMSAILIELCGLPWAICQRVQNDQFSNGKEGDMLILPTFGKNFKNIIKLKEKIIPKNSKPITKLSWETVENTTFSDTPDKIKFRNTLTHFICKHHPKIASIRSYYINIGLI